MYVLVGHKKDIQQWSDYTRKVKPLWVNKLLILITWSLFLKTPVLKVQFSIIIKVILKLYECCNSQQNLKKLNNLHHLIH